MQAPSESLPGTADIRARLADLVAADRLHSCLLFEGPTGVGKAQVARWLAGLVACQSPRDHQSCGACWSCRQVARGSHPDVVHVGLDPDRKAPIISAEQARSILETIAVQPSWARRRTIILDPADALHPAAANALLKTFEEPPSGTGFILVTAHASRLLPTVRSRCQRLRFVPLDGGNLARWLEARGHSEPDTLAQLADGSPGRALELAAGGVARWRATRDELDQVLAGSMGGMVAYAERTTKGDREAWAPRVTHLLDVVSCLARDAVLWQFGTVAAERLYNGDHAKLVARWADGLGPSGATRVGLAVDEARRDLERYINGRLLVETLVARVATELGSARGDV